MPLFTRKDFAAHCKIEANALRSYISRGSVVEREDGFIDSSDQFNNAFYLKQKSKWPAGSAKEKPAGAKSVSGKTKEAVKPEGTRTKIKTKSEHPDFDESVKQLKHLDTLKRQHEIEVLKLKTEKMKGAMVPSALMIPVITQHNQHLTNAFKNAAEELIRIMAKKKDFSGVEIAEMRGTLVDVINKALINATNSTEKSIHTVIEETTEARGKGERSGW